MKKKNNDCEGQLSLADIFSPAEVFYMTTGRTDYWQQSSNIVFNDDGIPVLEEKSELPCEGCIFDTKNGCCSYPITKDDYCVLGNKKITNKLIKQLIDDLEDIYPEKIDGIEYQVWEHVPKLGKRLWLNIEAVGEEWDLTEIIDKYKEASLEVSVSAVPHFLNGKADVEGNSLYISTMWTTKGHKELIEYKFETTMVQKQNQNSSEKEMIEPPFDKSLLAGIKGIDEIIPDLPKYEIVLKKADFKGRTRKTAVWVGYWHSINDSGWNYEMEDIESYTELKKNECKFSGHTCNKEELWKVAETLDDPFCPHVCCRKCATKQCGARCNGSEEPKEAAEKPECSKANECEAYPHGCGGRIEPCRFGGPYKWSEQAQEVVIKGICDDGYCPKCNIWLDDLIERCPECNTLLDWTHWKRLNEEGEQDENSNRTL